MSGYGHLKTKPLGLGVNASQFASYLRPVAEAPPGPTAWLAELPLN